MRFLLVLVGLGILFVVLSDGPGGLPGKVKARLSGHASPELRSKVEALSARMLLPLEKVPPAAVAQAASECERLAQTLRATPSDPEARRLLRVCDLLKHAIAEREEYLRRALRGSQPTSLDRVPGEWHVKGTGLNPAPNKPINVAQYHQQMRSGFFAQSALRQWQSRASLYQARIQQLLAADSAGR